MVPWYVVCEDLWTFVAADTGAGVVDVAREADGDRYGLHGNAISVQSKRNRCTRRPTGPYSLVQYSPAVTSIDCTGMALGLHIIMGLSGL